MSDKLHIFLSYQHFEFTFASKLAAGLKNAGFRMWMDRLDGIQVGDDWRGSIEQALTKKTCAAVISVLSPNYVNSLYCRNEMARANRLGIPIYPLLLCSVSDEDWPIELERSQYLCFVGWQDEQIYRSKLEKLIRAISEKWPEQRGDIPDPETQYLTNFMLELEAKRGVLQYIELDMAMDTASETRPMPCPDDEWGFAVLAPELVIDIPNKPEAVSLKSISEATREYPRFVLIGAPGIGKTTTVRHLARNAAQKRLDNPRVGPLPLLLHLSQWGEQPTLFDFIRAQWSLPGDLAEMMKNGDIQLYLDGLNEMGETGSHKAELLRDWLNSSEAPARVIITCRTADYSDALRLEGIPTILAQEMTEDQIERFASRYLKDRAGSFLRQVLYSDVSRYESTRSLFKLARNPYMLSALIYIYENEPSGELPFNAGTLFQRLAQAAWKREQQRGTLGRASFEQTKSAFAQLAFSMIKEETSIDISTKYMVEKTGDEQFLGLGLGASYIVENSGNVRFYHQSFQEYFAAEKVEADLQNNPTTIGDYAKEARWSEVLFLLAGFTNYLDHVLNGIVEKDATLAARCLAQRFGPNRTEVPQAVVDRIINAIGQMAEGSNWSNCRLVADIFAELRVPGSSPFVVNLLAHNHHEVRWGAIHALRNIGEPSAVTPLIDSLTDSDWVNRGESCVALAELLGNQAIKHLIPLLTDGHPYVRGRASYAIYLAISKGNNVEHEEYLREQPSQVTEVFKWILSLVHTSTFWNVLESGLRSDNLQIAEAALNILVEEQKRVDRKQAIAVLDDLLSHHVYVIRAGATQALGRLHAYEKIPLVVEIMQTDPVSVVRGIASVTLKILNAREAIPSMVKQLHNDKAVEVRRRILLNFIEMQVPSVASDVLSSLDDSDAENRALACRYLGEFGDVSTKPVLMRLEGDQEPIVQEAAQGALIRISRRKPLQGQTGTKQSNQN